MSFKESDLKKEILQAMKDMGAWSYAPVQMGMGEHGIPDRIACRPYVIQPEDVGRTVGLFVGIEAKIGSNKLSRMQSIQLTGIADAYGEAFVIRQKKKDSEWEVRRVTIEDPIRDEEVKR